MKPVVAVEDSLGNVADYLAANGFEVRRVKDLRTEARKLEGCKAVVISGLDRNFAGYAGIKEEVPVIEARGQKPDAILTHVLARTGLAENAIQ